MHKNSLGRKREEIVEQVKNKESSVKDYNSYIPIGNAASKVNLWKGNGFDILYLTSRRKLKEIKEIKNVLNKNNFPAGRLLFRKNQENYSNIIEKEVPDFLVEDDCESISGRSEMSIFHVRPEIRKKIKLIEVKEFGGIDHLKDNLFK